MKRHVEPARFLKALAHPARLEIAEVLRDGEACVCHLEARLGYRQPYISQQITVLRRAGLLAERRDGTYVFYRLADRRVGRVLDTLMPEAAREPSGRQKARTDCTCPHCAAVAEAAA